MLENVILGLLLYKKLSIYDMKKAIEQSVGFFYSSSYGNIHPAMKKLEAKGFVSVQEKLVHGRNRKEYSITEEGIGQFQIWLSQDIKVGKIQDEGLLHLYFLAELKEDKRIELLNRYIEKLSEKVIELSEVENAIRKIEVPDKYREALNYRIITIDFGLKYYKFELTWYKDIINKIKRKEI